jgi:zinc transport system permease protein
MGFELFLSDPYFERVFLTALVVAAVGGVLGVFLVLRNLSLLGDGIAHIAFAGIAIAFAAGFLPLPTSIVWASLGALTIQELRRRGIVKGDTAIGIIFTTSLALGYMLIYKGSVRVDVESFLFGNLLFATTSDLNLALGTALIVAVFLALLWRPLFALTFDLESAEVLGLPIRTLESVFTVLVAASIVVAARVVGVLLVSSLVVVPAATSLQFARGFRGALLLAPLIALATVTVGMFVSATWVFPAGTSIALVSGALFLGAVSLRRLVGARA